MPLLDARQRIWLAGRTPSFPRREIRVESNDCDVVQSEVET